MKIINALLLGSLSTAGFAGTMGAPEPSNFFMVGGGIAYSHSFYKDNYTPAESYANPITYNVKNIYADDFFGGYMSTSWYNAQGWMANAKYELYSKKAKFFHSGQVDQVRTELRPARASISVDKVWGNIYDCTYGVGIGAVHEALNEGAYYLGTSTAPIDGSSINYSRIDPMVEAFVMKAISTNWNAKFNVAYQFNTRSKQSEGDLLLNLGINYVIPV